ncbi:MAG TPA: DNA gyrase subunit A [Microthrixaceae bacterium]|nr:DNA gyrase subunit A [Microthrixaceae bacterium]HNI33766.1 DNA gyrase subunit A [Microthrixaceae bacterium]
MADDNEVTPDGNDDGAPPLSDLPGVTYGSIEPIEIQTEMEQSFLDYAMSVIVSRALPDVRDGLKPVHRRIFWAMHEGGLRPDRPHKKCATVVGDVLGKYHPHGDQSVYYALVRMGQDFSVRHVLVDKHGNFGSPSDEPAAYRYTECRLSNLATHLLANIDEDTVDMTANFDGSTEEPVVLPSRFPNLLVNGSQGIAVGMATNIPTHNLGEVIDATLHLLENPEATVDDLMEFVKGPDFPTGGQIMGRAGILDAYRTGRGSVKIRAKAEIVPGPRGEQIVVSEIPYQTSVEAIEAKAAELVNAREIEGIRAIRNGSAKGKIELVFELKKDAPALVILNNLYKHTPMQSSFAVNMVALVDGVPRTLNLRDVLWHYIAHQRDVIRRRSEYRLDKAQQRAHIVEGLLKALDMIDEIIAAIRASEDKSAAREALRGAPFEFSETQAEYILDMQLSALTRLGRARLEEELAKLRETIAELQAILGDDAKLREVIATEMTAIRDEFANPRRSPIEFDPGDLDVEDLIDDEEIVVMMTSSGYIKTVSSDAFRTQGRGGRGVAGTKLKDDDFVTDIIHTSVHAYLLFFSNRGRVYRLKAYQIPMMERTARGTALVNLLQLQPDERIQTIIDTRDYETNRYLFFVTRNGVGKKTLFNAYDSSRQAGLIAINLRDDDELVGVFPTNDGDDVMCISQNGQGIRFSESDVRPMGRDATGVRAMKLRDGDAVVSADVVAPDHQLLVITDEGFGKRTDPSQFRVLKRGAQGIRAIGLREGKGHVVSALMVATEDQLFLIADSGVTIRVPVDGISEQGRDASGVRVMNLDDDSHVVAVARVLQSDDDDDGVGGDVPADELAADAASEDGTVTEAD